MQKTYKMWVQYLGQEDPLEKGMTAHSSILAWRIPWTEEPGELQTIGLQKIEHNWSDLACTEESVSNIFYWERDFEMEYKQIILILSWSDRFTPILIN